MTLNGLALLAKLLPACSWLRSLAKTVTWRFFATIDTFLISALVTRNLKWAGSIVGIEVVTKMGWYLLHERAWARLSLAASPPPSASPQPRPHPELQPAPEVPSRTKFGALGVRCLAVHVHHAARSSALN
jgi:uncharacterized membrane protein